MINRGPIAKSESTVLQKRQFVVFEIFEDEADGEPDAPIITLNLGHAIASLGHKPGPGISSFRRRPYTGDCGNRDACCSEASRQRCVEGSQRFRSDLAEVNR